MVNYNPQQIYYSFLAGLPSPVQDYYRRNFQNVYAQYYADLPAIMSERAKQGINRPPPAFESYLQTYPWLAKYQGVSPRERGSYPATLAPPARKLNY